MANKIKSIIVSFLSDRTGKSAVRNLGLKTTNLLLTFVYTPLLLNYLGDEKYGLWSILLSVITWINYCDVGIGHGLRNVPIKRFSFDMEEVKK